MRWERPANAVALYCFDRWWARRATAGSDGEPPVPVAA
jgi:hypothetical protein